MKDYYLFKNNPTKGFDSRWTDDVKIHNLSNGIRIYRGENISIKTVLLRLYFRVISKGTAFIYYIVEEDRILHYSYVIGKCFKFPFLKKGDCVIGPCFTEEKSRGKGLYPKTLSTIVYNNDFNNYYMIVHKNNLSSIRGICKAGFDMVNDIEKTKILKIYR